MSTIEHDQSADFLREDARALQQRLCREIGIAAVAAALGIARDDAKPVLPRQNPAILVLQDKAA